MKKVVITGMGVVSPVGNTIDEFWKAVRNGESGIGYIDRFDTSEFAVKIGGQAPEAMPEGLTNKHLRRYDMYSMYAMYAADEAWKHAGLNIDNVDPLRGGVIIGSGIGGISTLLEQSWVLKDKGPKRVSPLTIPKLLSNMGAGNVGTRLGLRGPTKCVVTACATAAHAIGDGMDTIRMGRADFMVVGGAEYPLDPFGVSGFMNIKALTTDFNDRPKEASRAFDKDRSGFVMSEGAGIMVLESEEHAKARGATILAEVAGCGQTGDAYHMTAPRPDGDGAVQAMKCALVDADLAPSDIAYFNAHGTSTHFNDLAESIALRTVFGADTMPPVSSTKSVVGHLLGAAGAAEGIASVMAIRESVMPPSINFVTPDPECEVNLVANTAREADVSVVMSNSLGFGGQNASLIFKRYE